MASATKRARTRAERKYEWIREIAAFVSKYVRFPEARFPDLQMPSDPARISLSQVEDAASDCRKFFGNAAEPITNVAWLLETNGAVVARFEMHAATLDAFSEWAPGDARPYIMLSSDKQSAVRSRFDAAHELAHMVLHRHTPRELVGQKATFDLMEAQAHRFASAFLLPEDAFVDELYAPTLDAFLSLKSRWKVAISAMIRRSTDLRLINEEQAKHLWINLGRRRWRTREPLDDEIEPEVPRLLARSVKGLIDRQTISPGEIPFQIGLPPADVEQMLGLPANTLGHYPSEFDLPEEPLGGRDYPAVIRFPDAS